MLLCDFILFWTKHNLSVVADFTKYSVSCKAMEVSRVSMPLIYWAQIMSLLTMTMSLFSQLYFLYVQNKTKDRAVQWN
jgi:hypothetical protein